MHDGEVVTRQRLQALDRIEAIRRSCFSVSAVGASCSCTSTCATTAGGSCSCSKSTGWTGYLHSASTRIGSSSLTSHRMPCMAPGHVVPGSISAFDPAILDPLEGGSAPGDRRSPPTTRGLPSSGPSSSSAPGGSVVLDLALPPLDPMALGAGPRPARDGPPLAPRGVPPPLAAHLAGITGATTDHGFDRPPDRADVA